MAAAGEADDIHPGGAGRLDSGDAVLDDEAVGGREAHLTGCEQEEVGRGLAARHLMGAEDVRGEAVEKSDPTEAQRELFGAAAGGDAERMTKARECLVDALDCAQIASV